MSQEVVEDKTLNWTTLDEELARLQIAEGFLASSREEVDTIRHRILQTLERDGGHTYHGDVGTAALVRTRKVVIAEKELPIVIDAMVNRGAAPYYTLVPEHFELTPLFMAHARDGVFQLYGVEVKESLGVRITYNQKKG